eukprot:COSAG02_NODE_3254_length_7085_cov_102.140281_4_plen_82_part_00
MSAQAYVAYYDAQVKAMQESAGGAVSKFGGPSLAGVTVAKADEWAPLLLDARNHQPTNTHLTRYRFINTAYARIERDPGWS